MKKLILLMALAMIVGLPADAKRKKKKESKAEKKEAPVRQGLFSVQKDGDKWFFLVPDSLMGSPFLAITRYVSTPSGAGIYGGEEVNEQTFYWEKVDGRLLLRSLVYLSVADSTQAIARAVKASAQDPIVESFKIEATKKDSAGNQSYKVEIGRLFAKENVAVGLDANSKKRLGLAAMNTERSFIKAINTYPINTEIKTVRTYNSKEGGSIPAGQVAGAATFEMNTSFVLLPKVPMRKRLFDPRVGYFAYYFAPFDDGQQSVRNKEYISRWRLEPREEDIEKMKRGELVEPKKQIVYYIDPATPKQWRPYLIQGVNDWNAAFEQAGFKNAIVGKEWPDDSTMSMEDARFSVIRYLASPISNAYGPHVSDPRSGEILESHVGWYHNVMKLVHDWYMIQAGCSDSTARKMKFDDELMGQLIRFVSSHEIGHTLGLRHNMGASHATPVDSLRNKEWVEKHGHTASIMDYARFNYVAQPEDNVGRDGLFPRVNDYDKWAIEWGYKPLFGTADEEEDRLVLNKMIVEQLKKGPRYWFGGEGYDNDPRAQTEDLGDNAVRASEYGIMNLKRIVKALPDWTHEEADLGRNIKEMHGQVINQFMRYEGHVLRNIGGIYTTYKSTEEPGPVYTPQTKAGVICAENIWKWKMQDYRLNGSSERFDRMIRNCIQYLASNSDKSLLRVYHDKTFNQDTDIEFDAELYNQSYQLNNTPELNMSIRNAQNREFKYTFSRRNNAYHLNIGQMEQGRYTYTASAKVEGVEYKAKGSFVVKRNEAETVNLQADHSMLYTLSKKTHGCMFSPKDMKSIIDSIALNRQVKPIIHQVATNHKLSDSFMYWLVLIVCFGAEWFLRKYWGRL